MYEKIENFLPLYGLVALWWWHAKGRKPRNNKLYVNIAASAKLLYIENLSKV